MSIKHLYYYFLSIRKQQLGTCSTVFGTLLCPHCGLPKKFRYFIFRFSFLFLFVVVVSHITSTTICCSRGREIVVVLSQGFVVVKRSIRSSGRKSSLRLRSHAQDKFLASWKFMRLGVLFTRNHLNRTKVLVQSFLWKEQNYWTIQCEWSVRSNFSAGGKFVRKWTAPANSHLHAHTAHIRTNWLECRS